MVRTTSGMDTGRRCAMARCRVGVGEGDGDGTTGGVGGVRAPGGSSRERGSQNSPSETTANAARHRIQCNIMKCIIRIMHLKRIIAIMQITSCQNFVEKVE
jgi:hypothetical protein